MKNSKYATSIFYILKQEYPDATCGLIYNDPFQLLIATILSARCTDKAVNSVTPFLFSKYPIVDILANAEQKDVEQIIKPLGLFKNKSKNIINSSKIIVTDHQGNIPDSMEKLVKLKGVGRKTANVLLGNGFNKNEGIAVDTHVARVANRLKLSTEKNPIKIETDLMKLFSSKNWTMISHLLIIHGRTKCKSNRPLCMHCKLQKVCPYLHEKT